MSSEQWAGWQTYASVYGMPLSRGAFRHAQAMQVQLATSGQATGIEAFLPQWMRPEQVEKSGDELYEKWMAAKAGMPSGK